MRRLVALSAILCVWYALASMHGTAPSAGHHGAEAADSVRMEILAMADTASPEVRYRIAAMFESGTPWLAPDSAVALRLVRQAADSAYAPALNYLGFKYITGQGVDRDSVLGLRMIRQAADMGDPRSYNNLGWLYLNGDLVPRDLEEARRWFTRASDAGVPTASATLADMYRYGQGVSPDTLLADSLYTLAIHRGLADAQLKLIDFRRADYAALDADSALRLALKFYPAPGPAVGIVLLRVAAAKGHPRAEALLGDAYSRGVGVKYDHLLSLIHFYKAAVDGNPSAQFVIAELLDMFPDALRQLPPDVLPAGTEIIEDAQYWYSRAGLAGISDAATATDFLLDTSQ